MRLRSSGANSASAASTMSQTRSSSRSASARRSPGGSVAPVGSLGVQSAIAVVSAHDGGEQGVGVRGAGGGQRHGRRDAARLVDEPRQRAPAGPGDRDLPAGPDRAERGVQQLAGAVARAPPGPA